MGSTQWKSSEELLLREEYASSGSAIPKLLEKYSPAEIRAKAKALGLRCDRAAKGAKESAWTAEDIALLKTHAALGAEIPELRKKYCKAVIYRKARALGIQLGTRTKWTAEEDEILKANYAGLGVDIPSLLETRTRVAIQQRARTLGLNDAPADWTEEEIVILQREYSVSGMDIPALLQRHTADSIRSKANKLGLSSPRTWTEHEDSILEENAGKCTAQELSRLLPGRSVSSILNRLQRQGVIKDVLKSIQRRNADVYYIARAYTGTNGKEYVFIQCTRCGAIMLIPLDDAGVFQHGTACISPSVIDIEFVPKKVVGRIQYRHRKDEV